MLILKAAMAALIGLGAGQGQTGGGIPLAVKQTDHCSAFAPADWTLTSNPQASTADANSGDHSMYAGWGAFGVNRAMQPYYGDLYGDPEASIRTVTSAIVQGMGDPSGIRYRSAPQPFLDYFLIREVESAQYAGLVFYHVYPGPGPQQYIESMYFALARKNLGPAAIRLAAGVAVSLRCQTQLIPVRFSPPGSGSGKRAPRVACGTGGNLRGYNKELGTQYAHSPTTGENFLFDPSAWQENGPQGPGYYRSAGNSYEKLELGRDDDC
jgi:hypothetical protein